MLFTFINVHFQLHVSGEKFQDFIVFYNFTYLF